MSVSHNDPHRWISVFVGALEKSKVDWAIIGELAADAYRMNPRPLSGFDCVVSELGDIEEQLRNREIEFQTLFKENEADGSVEEPDSSNGVDSPDETDGEEEHKSEVEASELVHLQGTTADGLHFDIHIALSAFEMSSLRRKRDGMVSPEDFILYKLLSWTVQDRDDIREVLAKDLQLDVSHIERWARKLDVSYRWDVSLSVFLDSRRRYHVEG